MKTSKALFGLSTSAQAGAQRCSPLQRGVRSPVIALAFAASVVFTCFPASAAPLTPLAGSPYAAGGTSSQNTLLSRDGKFLFVSSQTSRTIKVMNVAANGSLSLVGSYATTPASATTGMDTSPDGTKLYLTTLGSTVNVHEIAANGSLTQIQAAPLGTPSSALTGISYVRASGGDFVYVNNNVAGANTVTGFPVLANGTLGAPTTVTTGGTGGGGGYYASPRLMCRCLATQRLFVLNAGSSSVSVFDIATNGVLTLVGSPVAIGGTSSGAIAVNAPATYLYAGRTNGQVTKFSIGATGALTLVGTFSTGLTNSIDGMTVSPGGAFLVPVDTQRIAIVDTTTMLPVVGSPVTASGSTSAEFNQAGTVLYVGTIGVGVAAYQFFSPDPRDRAPIANAGTDFSVNEGQTGVALDGGLSSDPDGDALAFAWTQVPGGTAVTLTGANTASPTFTAPVVALGGETLSFDLTVTANGKTSTDTVSVTVVNVNHPPVADAGIDQSIAEGSPVTLDGSASFDIDSDVFTHAWTQVSGPAVTLTGANTSGPTFTAPYAGNNGATGVVATLVFELLVDDGFPADAPATGYTLANVRDRVTVEITNTNNLPIANAGADQTVDENSAVALSSELSSDPDSDILTSAWTQTGGPAVSLTGAATATPSFTAPFVSAGGADLTFSLTVDDGYGGTASDSVVIHVQNMNDPPLASAAQPTVGLLWPPNHQMIAVGITGVSDPNNNATITITGVTQDEPTNGLGDGDTPIDAVIDGGTVLLRSERSGKGDGRVYRVSFTASDLEGSSSGMVKVVVPHSVKKPAVDSSGALYDSTN